MHIHEYQAKNILSSAGITIKEGVVIDNVDQAKSAYDKLNSETVVIKAQVHLGGRGKYGGILFAKSADETIEHARKLLGSTLTTNQSGQEQGLPINKLYIEAAADIAQEFYVSLLPDDETKMTTFVVSADGGGDIEQVAQTDPDKIMKLAINPIMGMQPFHGRLLAGHLGLTGVLFKQAVFLFKTLYEVYQENDATLLEINPLSITAQNELLALDCKMIIDDNAMFRQIRLAGMHDESQEEAMEIEAKKHDLNYVKLNGNIGCMVNGAGLAMATMDIISLYGASPANFLDVGGSATQERVEEALKLLSSDNNVKAILINIFGGIVHCDMIARGIVEAIKKLNIQLPIVVRLEGTNADLGREILDQSGMTLISAQTLDDAAQKATQLIDSNDAQSQQKA